MATQAYRIVSHDTTLGKEPANTVEAEAILSADADALWESEAGPSNLSLARRIPPRFVPASSTYSTIQQQYRTSTSLAVKHESGDIGSWYAGLSRVQQASEQHRHPPEPTPIPTPPAPASKPKKKQPPSKNDWFIRRALSNAPADTQPVPRTSLADMLEQSPPSLEDPLRPPIFLHLGPSNRGWGMLQRHGWEEGQPLGLGSTPQTPPLHDQPAAQTPPQLDVSAEPTANAITNNDNLAASSRTALVTPLRTTLKVDKRGIAPRSKTTPKPAVTHTFHEIRIAAEKARRERDGRGKRGFARTAKREAEERSRLLQELK